MQLEEHFSRPMKEFVSLCLKKVPAEVIMGPFIYLIYQKALGTEKRNTGLHAGKQIQPSFWPLTFRGQVLRNYLSIVLSGMLEKVPSFWKG